MADQRETRIVLAIFALLLAYSLWGISVGWKHEGLYGNEFRETQTAISALFIQRDNDFSLAYPTPVLGKPWSIPMEFPLYQWTVVAVSNATGLPLSQAGRLASVLCFYLSLPAFYLLLGRVGLSRKHALIVLSLILTCPLYLFYARAFLIETMALMFGAWYLVALIKAIEQRHLGWLLAANLAGIGVGLVKVTTFIVFLMPAFACSVWWIWRSWAPRAWSGWKGTLRTTGWLTATHALPFLATYWWIGYADAVKSRNPNGAMLESSNLTGFNFGGERRFEPEIWALHWQIVSREIAVPLVLALGAILALAFGRRWWWQIAAGAGLYLLIQAIFPLLYAWHAYYHVASAFLLVAAIGLALVGGFERVRWRFIPFMLWAALLAGNIWAYFDTYYPTQSTPGHPAGIATALNRMTKPEEVVIIAGDDWASIIPYYAERRALMLRGGVVDDEPLLRNAFALLKDEPVAALVLMDVQLNNTFLHRLASEYFPFEAEPTFTWRDRGRDAAIYLHRQVRLDALEIKQKEYFHHVELVERAESPANPLAATVMTLDQLLPRHRSLFRIIQPQPVRFFSTFGPELRHHDEPGMEQYAAHPETKLWFKLPPGRRRLTTMIDLIPHAYEGVPHHDSSDGVELVAAAIHGDGTREILHRRHINPRDNPADRGPQPIDWSFDLPESTELELSVNAGPHGNGARDWATLSAIRIE